MYKMCLTMDIKNIMNVDETKATNLASKILKTQKTEYDSIKNIKDNDQRLEKIKELILKAEALHGGFQRQKIF